MAKYQAYAEYKDSGVEWLGEIPSHWDLRKFKHHFRSAMGETILGADLIEDGKLPVYSATEGDHFFGYVNSSSVVLEKGDFVIPARGNSIGFPKLVVTTSTCSQTTIYAKMHKKIHSKFTFYYLLGCKPYLFQFVQTAIPQITVEEVKNNHLVHPSLEEQIQIANFLDHETAKIDHLIEKQQQLIELLKEKRQAVISHAVTKGLDPNVPMKDSGVEWLGEVPEHWDIKKIKYLGSILNGYAFPSDGFTEEGIKVLKISNIQTMYLDWTDLSFVNENQAKKLEQFLVKKGDLVFALTRPIISTGIKATLMDLDEKILLNQRNAILRPNGLCIQKWLYYMILNQNFVQEFNNQIDKTGQQPNISTVAIGNLEISVAPIEEQIKIVEFIAEKVERIDDLIKKAESAIQLMQERRTALISAAVTGKIDVRNWQAPTVADAHTELSA